MGFFNAFYALPSITLTDTHFFGALIWVIKMFFIAFCKYIEKSTESTLFAIILANRVCTKS